MPSAVLILSRRAGLEPKCPKYSKTSAFAASPPANNFCNSGIKSLSVFAFIASIAFASSSPPRIAPTTSSSVLNSAVVYLL